MVPGRLWRRMGERIVPGRLWKRMGERTVPLIAHPLPQVARPPLHPTRIRRHKPPRRSLGSRNGFRYTRAR
jgi:hypothetical protein